MTVAKSKADFIQTHYHDKFISRLLKWGFEMGEIRLIKKKCKFIAKDQGSGISRKIIIKQTNKKKKTGKRE
jgi:hypothetical protein